MQDKHFILVKWAPNY